MGNILDEFVEKIKKKTFYVQ